MASLLPKEWLDERARHHKVIVRQRKVHIFPLIWTLMLGFAAGNKRSITALREAFEKNAGLEISRSGFYKRFGAPLVALLKDAFDHVLEQATEISSPLQSEVLHSFTRIFAIDTTVLTLWELLAGVLPSTTTGQAAAKLHIVYNVVNGRPSSVQITEGKRSDQSPWKKIGQWVQGALLLVDLGYYNFGLFHRIDRWGGLFVSRAKTNFNGVIVGVNGSTRGCSTELVGRKVQEVLPRLKRRVLDVQVKVGFLKGKYRGVRRRGEMVMRLVGLWDEDQGRYRLYLTNLSPEQADGDAIGELYRLRWQVELLMRALQSHHRVHQVPTGNRDIAMALMWASLVSLVVERVLLKEIRRCLDVWRHITHLRFSALFERMAGEMLRDLLTDWRSVSSGHDPWLDFILHEAPDPNHDRWTPLNALSRS